MHRTSHAMVAALALAASGALLVGEFKPYPGARTEPWLEKYKADANKALQQIGRDQPTAEMWITGDAFDKVRAFYVPLGAEDAEFGAQVAKNLSDSTKRQVRATYVVFDKAENVIFSKYYVMIQRPVVTSYHPLTVHDVTMIGLYKKR